MAGYTDTLNESIFDNNEVESIDKTVLNNDSKNEVKILDITQQQWFWDQGVMS